MCQETQFFVKLCPNRTSFETAISQSIKYKYTKFVYCCQCYKTIYEKPKASIQIIKNAKRNRYKRTNEHWYSRSPITSSQGDWDEVQNENQTHIN